MYFLCLLFSPFVVYPTSAAGESEELVRVLNEIMELKHMYLQMEESMNIKLKDFEDKIKSLDEKNQNLEEENTRLKVAIQKQVLESKKITKLEARMNSQGKRIRFLEENLVKKDKMLQLQRRTPVMVGEGNNENWLPSVAWFNSTKKERGEKSVTHKQKHNDGSRSKRVFTTSISKRDVGNSYAFYAYMSNDLPSPSAHHTFIYDHVVTNDGGHYNRHSGIFTVPESGVYVLSATSIINGDSVIFYEIVKNSSPFATGISNSGSIGNVHTGTLTGIIQAEKGDIIYVRSQNPTSVGRSLGTVMSQVWSRTSFCGWRIQ